MTDIRIPGTTYGCGLAHAEREALETFHSTDDLLQRAARKASPAYDGFVELGSGGVRTFRTTKAGQQPLQSIDRDGKTVASGVVEITSELAEHALEKFLLKRGATPATAGLGPLVGGALAAKHVAMMLPQAWDNGDAQRTALYRDARFAAIVSVVAGLPPSYVEGELAKRREVTASTRSPANRIALELMNDATAVAILQLRCDEGMKVAEKSIAAKQTRDDFLSTRDDLRARYHGDAAFRIGFDAMLRARADGAAMLERTVTALRQRESKCTSKSDVVFTR